MRHLRYLYLGFVFLTTLLPQTGWADPVWPVMREFLLGFGVNLSAHRNEADIPLYDVDGQIRYWLVCRGDDREVDESKLLERRRQGQEAKQNPYVPWWPFTCVLSPRAEHPPESLVGGALDTLLAPLGVPSRPYQTRGSFGGPDLLGACGQYPEYGRVRHFRLRGFVLTLEFGNVTVDPSDTNQPDYGVFHVSLDRDPTAQTARAEPSGFLDPFRKYVPPQPRMCENVLRGEEPSSCYDPVSRKRGACLRAWAYEPESYEKHPYAIGAAKHGQVGRSKRWGLDGGGNWTGKAYLEKAIALLRRAAEERRGDIFEPILPAFPFPLLCGKAGTSEWASIEVKDISTWNRLWRVMLADPAFRGFERLTLEEVRLSPNYGVWVRGESFRFQDGLTVATNLSCHLLAQALD